MRPEQIRFRASVVRSTRTEHLAPRVKGEIVAHAAERRAKDAPHRVRNAGLRTWSRQWNRSTPSSSALHVRHKTCILGGPDLAAVMAATVCVREHRIAIAVDEVRRAERAKLGCERHHRGETSVQCWYAAVPQRRQSFEQCAERVLRVGVADPSKAVCVEPWIELDAVVGEDVDPSTQLARERLRVAQLRLALRGLAHVCDHARAPRRWLLVIPPHPRGGRRDRARRPRRRGWQR